MGGIFLVVAAQCLLCAGATTPGDAAPAVPLRVDVGTQLDFDRVAVAAPGGSVRIDPSSRVRTVTGAVTSLGGLSMAGSATVSGEPGRAVRVTLPAAVFLRTRSGGSAEVRGIATNLPPAPRLGPDGRLSFSFGGRLEVAGDGDGDYQGRVEITVEYQ